MFRIRSTRLMSGVSAIAVIAAAGSVTPALAGQTFTGPGFFAAYTNTTNADFVFLDGTAGQVVMDVDGSGNSLINNFAMSGTGVKIDINNSDLLGSFVNNASIVSSDNNGVVVRAHSLIEGSFINNSLIQGNTSGVLINQSVITGSVTNAGSIFGGSTGLDIVSNSVIVGNVSNTGSIHGGTDGLRLSGSTVVGNITNSSSGSITGGNVGIDLVAASTVVGNVANSGFVHGGSTGVRINNTTIVGNLTNGSGAIITGGSYGLNMSNSSVIVGSIQNSGSIGGGSSGIHMISSTLIGGLINNASGSITGGSDGLHIGSGSTFLGGIVNHGLISGGSDGIDLTTNNITFAGGISNDGTIRSTSGSTLDAAIEITVNTFSGGITNLASGVISGTSAADGIHFQAGTYSGQISNLGTIFGTNGIHYTGGTASGGIFNGKGGSIVGNGGAGAIWFEGKTTLVFNDGVENAGLIHGIGGADGIHMDAGTLNGGIHNDSGGTILVNNSGNGINIAGGTFNGGINNQGKILAGSATGGATGIYIHGATTFVGGITNSGTIHAANAGILVTGTSTFADGIINHGTIVTDGIVGDGIALSGASFSGGILNDGLINAASDGISWTAGSFTNNITNNGTIHGNSGDGLRLTSAGTLTGSVTNNGLLTAAGGYVGIDVGSTTTITGDVTNGGEGVINAGATGILVAGTVNGSVINNGVIDPNYGMTISGAVHGGVTNTDYIQATIDGIRITNSGTIDDGISNSGTVIAGSNAINLAGEGAATNVTQTGGLLRGNSAVNGSGTVTTALRLDQTGTEYNEIFAGKRGTVDGNIVGGGSDSVETNVANGDTFAFMRGTASGLDHFDGFGDGTVLLGTATRGVNGAGVTINTTDHMYFTGKGRLYIDDNTTANLTNYYQQHVNNTVEFYLTSNTAQHGLIAAGGEGLLLDGKIAAYVNGSTFGGVGGDTFTYANVMTGVVTGTFTNAANIEVNNSLFFNAEADVFSNHVDIVLHRESFSDALILPGMTQNETTMGNVLDKIYALGPGAGGYGTDFSALFDYLLSLGIGDEAAALAIYNELSGEEHAQLQQTTLDILNPFNTFMGQRLDQAKTSQGGVGFAAFGGNQYAQASAVMSDASPGMTRGDSGFSLWARGYGQTLKADGDPEAPGYDQNTGGAVGGVDLAIGQNSIVGAAVGWSSTDVDFKTPGDKASVDSFQVGAYGSAGFGRFYLDGEVAGAFHDLSTTRFLNLPNPPGGMVAGANYNARSLAANGEFGAVWRSGNFIFQPNAGVMFTDVDTDAVIESGAGDFNLIIHDSSAQSLASSLGARFATQFKAGGMNIMPEVSAAWRHEFDDDRQSFTAAFPDDPTSTFNIISSKINADSALVEAGVTAGVTKNVELFLNYNGLLNSDVDVHNGSAGLRATW